MSYEGDMLGKFKMPPRHEVEKALLRTLFEHNGVISEFGEGENIVSEVADIFQLNTEQRSAFLETTYRKENRIERANLWHRLLFRAADRLAKQSLISRPTQTALITSRKEWMLTERGFDKALKLQNIPNTEKEKLTVKSYEVEKLVAELKNRQKPKNYNPFTEKYHETKAVKAYNVRVRSFRSAVVESYGCSCAVCGMKIYSPKRRHWEVQAAHIVPHSQNGKDDIWNGLSLCHFHHWTFDVGWFSLDSELCTIASKELSKLPADMGMMWEFNIMSKLLKNGVKISLPEDVNLWPDHKAVQWHRENVLEKV